MSSENRDKGGLGDFSKSLDNMSTVSSNKRYWIIFWIYEFENKIIKLIEHWKLQIKILKLKW